MINLLTPGTKVIARSTLTWTWHGFERQVIRGLHGTVVNPYSQTVNAGEALVAWDHLTYGDESVVKVSDVAIVQ